MPVKIKIEFCTSCGSEDIEVNGNRYYYPDCDITYQVTKLGTKVVDSNPRGKEKARLDQCEQDIAELKGQKPAEPAEPTEPDDQRFIKDHLLPTAMDEEESEQDGFINW